MQDNLIKDCDSRHDVFLSRAKMLITEIRKTFANKMASCQYFSCFPKHFIRVIALFLMAEKASRFNDDSSKVISETAALCVGKHKDGDQWMTDESSQIEKDLWTLYVAREVGDGPSQNDCEELFSRCLDAIVREPNKSRILCLMLWLFPELATVDRIKTVEDIVTQNPGLPFPPTWCAQDLMLFWLTRVLNVKQEKVRDVGLQLRDLQSDSGAFSLEEGKEGADLVVSAMGLLSLISCAKRDDSESSVIGAAQKTVCWIVERLAASKDVDALSQAWSVYALSEYIAYLRMQYDHKESGSGQTI